MDLEAKRKLNDGDYEQALALYEGIIASKEGHDQSETCLLLLDKAQALILLLRFRESVDCYRKAVQISDISGSHISLLSDSLLKSIRSKCKPADLLTTRGKVLCVECRGILIEPVTSSCGHTCCLKCISKLDKRTLNACHNADTLLGSKVNVVIQGIVTKYFKNEQEACRKRLLGNSLLKDGKRDEALQTYFEAIKLDPNDVPLNSNISHIMTQKGQFDKGLQYADRVCKEQPGWAKGYYRRGCALVGLQRKPEAVFAFLQCLARDQRNEVVKKLVNEIIESMFIDLSGNNELGMITELMELFEKWKEITNDDAQKDHQGSANKTVKSNQEKWDEQEFECTLCCRLLYEPVTTPCGHVFCKNCLNRSLDHRHECPICRSSLSQVLASQNQSITDIIVQLMQTHLPDEFGEREKIHIAEMEQLASVASNTQDEIPIFVCTLAFPNMLCPLHIFEPRYRLMVRQCMESGSKQFGMCAYDEQTGFADYGTMLEIFDVQFLPDGRSLVNTIGGRRFKVLSKGKRDGYSTAKVEWITDDAPPVDEEDELKSLLKDVFDKASNWFNALPLLLRRRIVNSVSEMPPWQDNADKFPHGPEWLWWLVTVCPLDPKAQLDMLGLRSLKQRLTAMRRILAAIS